MHLTLKAICLTLALNSVSKQSRKRRTHPTLISVPNPPKANSFLYQGASKPGKEMELLHSSSDAVSLCRSQPDSAVCCASESLPEKCSVKASCSKHV